MYTRSKTAIYGNLRQSTAIRCFAGTTPSYTSKRIFPISGVRISGSDIQIRLRQDMPANISCSDIPVGATSKINQHSFIWICATVINTCVSRKNWTCWNGDTIQYNSQIHEIYNKSYQTLPSRAVGATPRCQNSATLIPPLSRCPPSLPPCPRSWRDVCAGCRWNVVVG